MSNIICPTCGLTSIDCGKAGYKTEREIELEKKLEIARKNLKEIGDAIGLYFRREHTKDFAEDMMMGIGIIVGQTEQELKEIKECHISKNTLTQ